LQLQEDLRKQVRISQATSKKLNKTEAVNSDLKKQLEVKEEVLKSINEKQTQLQTTIDGLTKTVDTMNHQLFEKQTQLQTNIDGLTKKVELLNEMSQLLCELPKDVSTCKIRAVTVS
jgi:chromosome segregation ATPase